MAVVLKESIDSDGDSDVDARPFEPSSRALSNLICG